LIVNVFVALGGSPDGSNSSLSAIPVVNLPDRLSQDLFLFSLTFRFATRRPHPDQ
jgi:hypothetical protein